MNILHLDSSARKEESISRKLAKDLVNNLKSKVAVKLKGNGLDSLKPLITIEDNTGKQITTFTTYKFGLGFFIIKPNIFKTYVAKLTFADVTYTYQLPEILQNGHTLNVRKKRQELLINLETNLEKGLFGSTVVIHQRGKLIFKNTVYLSQKKGMLKIPLLNFNSGVVNITLFNAEHKPVSERLYFVNNVKQHPFAKISTQKDFFKGVSDGSVSNVQISMATYKYGVN